MKKEETTLHLKLELTALRTSETKHFIFLLQNQLELRSAKF